MIVSKFTTPDGRHFFNADHNPALVSATLKRLPEGSTVDLIVMTPAQYQAIPATLESAQLWGSSEFMRPSREARK